MFRTLSLCSLLAFSLTCFAQITTTGGYATTSSPAIGMAPFSVANAPIASTPDIALPGSGPAVGAPLGNTNSNDSRISTGASVANRNSIYSEPAMSNVTAETGIPDNGVTAASNGATAASTTTAQAGTAEAYNMGIQHFESGLAGKSANSLSLAELARQVRGSRHPATRVINNDSIAQLNARGVTTGNIPIENPANGNATSTEAANPAPQTNAAAEPTGTLMARNQPPPFSQQQAPQQPAPAENATAGQQRHPAAESAGSTAAPQSTTAAAENQNSGANPSAAASTNKSLPQTGSHLPLLLLLGVLGVGAGSVYLLRR
jgi:LPXTG-motif cell wall-anchored protein